MHPIAKQISDSWNTLSAADLDEIIRELNFVRGIQTQRLLVTLRSGDTVTWDSKKMGRGARGKLIRVMRKYAEVQVENRGIWRVPVTMLKKLVVA
jgi:hypothetical protein